MPHLISESFDKMELYQGRSINWKRRGKAMDEFVKVRGKEFIKDNVLVMFKGLGIGSWLNIEHFMLGIPCTEYQMRDSFSAVFGEDTAERFFEKFADNFVQEADFAFLKSIGINLLRVPFHYRLFMDDENPSKEKEDGFRYFDRLLAYGKKYRIYILPDLHSVPGGQNPDWHSDNRTGYTQFWHFGVFREQMVRLWGRIAKRYCNEPYLLGYDLLNEPYVISDSSLTDKTGLIQEFYEDAAAEIRKYDRNHILFLEGDHFAMRFECLKEIHDKQTALMFHYYPTVWEPELFSREYDPEKRKKGFERVFAELAAIREQFQRPVLCGEAGYEINWEDREFTVELLSETLALCSKYQVSFTLWSYKDARFMGLVYPKKDSAWMELAGKFSAVWNHDDDVTRAEKALCAFSRKYYPEADDEELYYLTFRQRAILYSLQKKHLLEKQLSDYTGEQILRLPEAFRFEMCECFREYKSLLEKFVF